MKKLEQKTTEEGCLDLLQAIPRQIYKLENTVLNILYGVEVLITILLVLE